LEAQFILKVLGRVLPLETGFEIHPALPQNLEFWDEGAANHVRLGSGTRAIHLFVYGREAGKPFSTLMRSERRMGRQTDEACAAVARIARLRQESVVVARQSQAVIELGVFHNDVICASTGTTLIIHERALVDWPKVRLEILKCAAKSGVSGLKVIELTDEDISVEECVQTYVLNSQLVSLGDGGILMLCPRGCERSAGALRVLEKIRAGLDVPLTTEFVDLDESLANGGGPACLRLRVVVTENQYDAMKSRGFLADDDLLDRLWSVIEKRYRDRLVLSEFLDPSFGTECLSVLNAVTQALGYTDVYSFQG
jgi:succinylarginine dihydrolase